MKKNGKCCICNEDSELTFEHIPPKSIGNNKKAQLYTVKDIIESKKQKKLLPWELKGIKYKQQQKGTGEYSLCQKCNNSTGAWYGQAYTDLSKSLAHFLVHEKPRVNTDVVIEVTMKPLNFIKQVLSMFCTLNKGPLSKEISDFLLTPKMKLNNLGDFKVYMFLNIGVIHKFTGPMVAANTGSQESYKIFSEIDSYPMGFTLFYNGTENYKCEGIDITSFCSYEYNEDYTVQLPIPILESNNIFPQDFRSQKKIEFDMEINRRYESVVPEFKK